MMILNNGTNNGASPTKNPKAKKLTIIGEQEEELKCDDEYSEGDSPADIDAIVTMPVDFVDGENFQQQVENLMDTDGALSDKLQST